MDAVRSDMNCFDYMISSLSRSIPYQGAGPTTHASFSAPEHHKLGSLHQACTIRTVCATRPSLTAPRLPSPSLFNKPATTGQHGVSTRGVDPRLLATSLRVIHVLLAPGGFRRRRRGGARLRLKQGGLWSGCRLSGSTCRRSPGRGEFDSRRQRRP